MKKLSLKFTVIVLCILISAITLPRNTYASSTPAAPTNLTATVANSSQIYLKWDSVSDVSYYYVYRSTSSSGTYDTIGTAATTYYSDSALSVNTTYYYRVKAVNSSNASVFSNKAYATTSNASDVPDIPYDLMATAVSSTQIDLSWEPASHTVYYNVYRSTSSTGTYSNIAAVTFNYYSDTAVSEDITYYYKVQAVNSFGPSSYSAKASANTTGSTGNISAPTSLAATVATATQINLTWKAVSNATYYQIFRSNSSSGTYNIIGTSTTAKYNDSSISVDDTYYYKVKASNGSNISAYSSVAIAATSEPNDVPDAPANLTAAVTSATQIDLAWEPVSFATCYNVYRATSSSGTYSNIATATTSSYSDLAVTQNTFYYYKIKAVNGFGSSFYSPSAYVNTEDYVSNLTTPTNLIATVISGSQIYLKWDRVSNTNYYQVYRSATSSGTYNNIGTTMNVNYTDSSLSSDTSYYYKVKAVNGLDSSAFSSRAYATTSEPEDVPAIPTGLLVKAASSTQIDLTWEPVPYAISYYISRATSSSGTYTKISAVTSTSFSDTSAVAGTTYYYKIQAYNNYGSSSYSSKVSVNTTYATDTDLDDTDLADTSSQIQPDRLAGQNMYETSTEVAKAGWKTSYYALIVSGENFADALCSAPLAQKYNAPLLLTSKDSLNESTELQLSLLKVKNVIIIGGTGIISANVEQRVKNMGIEVSRIAGIDRYETSLKIAKSIGQFNQAVIANGDTFPDALSIAPIAAMKGMPILLTPKENLPDSIQTYLLNTVQSTYVVGGTGVVSDTVFKQLPSPKRLSGINRYETNISIIQEFANELDFSTCYFATGEFFADALTGSALAALSNSPVILVSNPVDQSTIDFFRGKMSSISKEIVFGGTVVVPDSIIISLHGISTGSYTLTTPTNVTSIAVSSGQINLTWDSVSGATSYYVYGATSSSGTFPHITTVTTTSYIDTGLLADTTYYYKVQAVNSVGSSSYSPIVYAKTTN